MGPVKADEAGSHGNNYQCQLHAEDLSKFLHTGRVKRSKVFSDVEEFGQNTETIRAKKECVKSCN